MEEPLPELKIFLYLSPKDVILPSRSPRADLLGVRISIRYAQSNITIPCFRRWSDVEEKAVFLHRLPDFCCGDPEFSFLTTLPYQRLFAMGRVRLPVAVAKLIYIGFVRQSV
jgi:hypothetical protein